MNQPTIMSTDDSEVLLSEMLLSSMDDAEERVRHSAPTELPSGTPKEGEAKSDKETHTQWALGGNGRFMPVGATTATLPAGIYDTFAVPGMWGLEQLTVASDGIYVLPDMATETVLTEVKKFWQSEEKYRAHKLLYKRGLILWGPPGGGKTVAVKLLMNELVKQNGVVIMGGNVSLTVLCLKAIRRIEPKRNLIVVFEDIDEIISYSGEAGILSMLDGENNVDNVLHLATTNHPDRLGARIINRPSRFDRRIHVGMPSAEARKAYLERATNGNIGAEVLTKWVADTDAMSIAHLRELVAAVHCLEQPYEEVVERLRNMAVPVKPEDGFKRGGSLGFTATGTANAW